MSTVIVYSVERNNVPERASETDAIRAAFVAARVHGVGPQALPVIGDWIGPKPRVTRRIAYGPDSLTLPIVGTLPTFETHAAWVYAWPDSAWPGVDPQSLASFLKQRVTWALHELSENWSEVEVRPYDPRAYGDLQWWQSGDAASSAQFVDTWATVAVPDNPTGPTGTQPHGTGDVIHEVPGQAVHAIVDAAGREAAQTVSDFAMYAAIAALIFGGFYFGPSIVASLSKSDKSKAA